MIPVLTRSDYVLRWLEYAFRHQSLLAAAVLGCATQQKADAN